MRRVRYNNVKPILKREWVYCGKKRNKPQMDHIVCEKNCREYKPGKYVECSHYSDWYYKYYGKELEVPESEKKRKKRK